MKSVATRILLVDDDPSTRMLFEGHLHKPEIALRSAVDLKEARRLFAADDYNLVLLDQRLPDGNGLDFFSEIRRQRPRQTAILITGFADVRDAMSAVRRGLFDYLTKPFDSLEALEAVIGRAIEMDRAGREISQLQEALANIGGESVLVGQATTLQKLNHQVLQVAPLDTTVLIEGESGTGKEVFARKIHALSSRAAAKMLEVNCGALSESLLEATLFGYEKGAFTGAAKATPGYLEAAHRGTLFLDEIADMSAKLQASLLRVLQDHSFSRLGSTAQLCSDFRLVCATNKPLDAEVREGRFRADLYYRLNVVNLRVPPLRERRADILPLAMFFLEHYNRRFQKQVGPITAEAAAVLQRLSWPGNVRELKHAIERTVAMKQDGPVLAEDFADCSGERVGAASGEFSLPVLYREARDHFERHYFAGLLRESGGNVSEAARLSGIARQNFHVHLRRLGLVST